jgi:hypothetical protein
LNRRIYVGLGVTSCNKSALANSIFDHVTITAALKQPAEP